MSLVLPRTARFFFPGRVLFHTGLYYVAGHPFFELILLNTMFLGFLDQERSRAWLQRLDAKLFGAGIRLARFWRRHGLVQLRAGQ